MNEDIEEQRKIFKKKFLQFSFYKKENHKYTLISAPPRGL